MGASGQGCLGVGLGLMRQSLGQVEELVGDRPSLFPQVHAHQGGDLVVAGSARAQSTAPLGADTFDEATFQRGVYVLVLQYGGEGPRGHVGFQQVQAVDHPVELVVGEQADTVKCSRVCAGTGDVVSGQAPVEVCAQ